MRWNDDTSRTVSSLDVEWADSRDSNSSSHDRSNERLFGSDRADRRRGSEVDGEGGLGPDVDEVDKECRGELLLSTRRMGRGSTTADEGAVDELMGETTLVGGMGSSNDTPRNSTVQASSGRTHKAKHNPTASSDYVRSVARRQE